MKGIIFAIFASVMLVSCTGNTNKTSVDSTVDSVTVDSVAVDSVVIDSIR